MNWKLTIFKSIIYRLITISLAIITGYILTGSLQKALEIGLATEAIQAVNYLVFELIWTYFYEKRLRQKYSKEFLQREVEMKLTVKSVIDMAKEFSEIDTFIPEIYNSLIKFYDGILTNKQMKEFHSQILEAKTNFETINKGRDFDS
jgi:uncharacterized membrane protein